MSGVKLYLAKCKWVLSVFYIIYNCIEHTQCWKCWKRWNRCISLAPNIVSKVLNPHYFTIITLSLFQVEKVLFLRQWQPNFTSGPSHKQHLSSKCFLSIRFYWFKFRKKVYLLDGEINLKNKPSPTNSSAFPLNRQGNASNSSSLKQDK